MNPSRCPCCLTPAGVVLRRFGVLALALACGVTWVWAQQPAQPAAPARPPVADAPGSPALALDKKIIEEAKKNSQVIPNLTYLCDVIGPRLTGSPALKKANEWTAKKMEEYGLSNVHLEPWTIPMGWERGTAVARIIEPDNGHTLTVAAGGWSGSTKGRIEGDVVVVKAGNTKELEAYKGKLKNAIVLRNAPMPVRPITDTKMQLPGVFRPEESGEAPKAADAKKKMATPPMPRKRRRPATRKGRSERNRFGRDFGQMRAFQNEMSTFLRAEAQLPSHGRRETARPHEHERRVAKPDRADAAEPLRCSIRPMKTTPCSIASPRVRRPPRRVAVEVHNKLIPDRFPFTTLSARFRVRKSPTNTSSSAPISIRDLGQAPPTTAPAAWWYWKRPASSPTAKSSRDAPFALSCSQVRNRACTAPKPMSTSTRTSCRGFPCVWSTTPGPARWKESACKDARSYFR